MLDLSIAKPGDVYKDKLGRRVRIICTDRKDDFYNVVGLVSNGLYEAIDTYMNDGVWCDTEKPSLYDLVEQCDENQ